jgi:glycosyltransferase involved in cell wall biosynthesis
MMMKISIVTISFNQKQYLKACIDSILSQVDCDLEYIIVDPGSTDGSRDLIDSYGDRIIKIFQPDQGPADGLAQGFAVASGEIYGFINSDDYLLPNALASVSDFFKRQQSGTFVTGQGFTEYADGRRTPITPNVLTKKGMLNRSAVLFQQATFFPAEMYQAAGGLNIQNQTCWDYELYLKFLAQSARHAIIDQALAVFRLHEGSISGSGRLNKLYLTELDGLFEQYVGRKRTWLDKAFTLYERAKREIARRAVALRS